MPHCTPEAVITIDCHYQRPQHAAVYLLIEDGRAAIIDTNTANAVPLILAALGSQGLGPESVEYIIPTHLHLDHAGGASRLAALCRHADVLTHPRGVRHYADPERLISGVKAVYGEEKFAQLFPDIRPIPSERVRPVSDGERLPFGSRTLTFLHTRGHANHHICIHDSRSGGVFTGDTFGVEYRPGREGRRPFLLCSCAPADFDPGAARDSIARLLALRPERIYLAHYGELTDVAGGADALTHSLDAMEAALWDARDSGLEGSALHDQCLHHVRAALLEQAQYCTITLGQDEMDGIQDHLDINAQGLACAAIKPREGPGAL